MIARAWSRVGPLCLVLCAATPVAPGIRAGAEQGASTSRYTVVVAFASSAPFVGDGRMTFANLAFSATFKDVAFVFGAGDRPCVLRATSGEVLLTRREFNEVQEGDDRHRPWVMQEWPKQFPALLRLAEEPYLRLDRKSRDGLGLVPLVPDKVKMRFRAEFGHSELKWFSTLGSAELGDMVVEFDVPFVDLRAVKPVSLRFPYAPDNPDPDEKGEWWIEFLPSKSK